MGQLKAAIRVSGLSFSYNGRPILKSVNTEIAAGKLTLILGRNGSGKSTFLRLLGGLLEMQAGKAEALGKDLTALSYAERASLIGFLNQQHKAVFPFSVQEVVLTGRAGFVQFVPKAKDRDAAQKAMEKAGILHLKDRAYTELSGGEQQLVMIARVLAQNPKILLLDEPTSHLDFGNQAHLLGLLKSLVAEGLTVVAVLHDPNLAFLYGEEFLFMKDGQLVRPERSETLWDANFLKTIYDGNLQAIPFNGRALLVPRIS